MQELETQNNLYSVMRTSLQSLQLRFDGVEPTSTELKLMALDLYYSRVIALNKTPSSSCLPSPPEAYGAKTSSKRSQNKFQQALCPAAASLLDRLLRLVWELQVSLHRLGIHFWIDQFTLPSLRFPGPRV